MSKTPDQNVITGQAASTAPTAGQTAMAQQVIPGQAASTAPMATQAATGREDVSLPADHPFYINIGRVASEWAHVEHILDLIIWQLADIEPQRGACITAQIMGINGRCKAIASLAGLQGLTNTFIKDVRRLMSDSYQVGDLRARVVHDPWYIEPEAGQVGQFKSMAYSDQRFGIQDVLQAGIDDTIRRIRELKTAADALYREIRNTLGASRQTQS